MNAIFSIELWFYLVGRVFNALLPILLVLLYFAWRSRRSFARSGAVRLFLIFSALDILVRFFLFFGGVPYQGRYFHVLIIICCILGAAGFLPFVEYVSRLGEKFKWLNYKKVLAGTVILVLAVHVGKALSPPDRKCWLDEIPALIRKNCPEGKKPILISEDDDVRIGYYGGAEYLKFSRPDAVNFFMEEPFTVAGKESRMENLLSLSDGKKDPKIEFEGTAELRVDLKKTYIYSRGTIVFCGEGLDRLEILLPENKKNNAKWLKLEKNLDGTYSANYLGFPSKSFKILVRAPEGTHWKLGEISLVLGNKWEFLRLGRENTTGFKFPVLPGRNISEIDKSISELGGDNVFVLVRVNDEKFRALFKNACCNFPFKFIAEKKDRRKGFYTLYQGRSR